MTYKPFYFLLTFIVIAISGNPSVGLLGKETIYIGVLGIFALIAYHKKILPTQRDAAVLLLFILLTVAHTLTFGGLVVNASIGFMIMLGIAMLAVRVIPNFSQYYVSIMCVLSLISLVFFIPDILGIDMRGLFSGLRAPLPWPEFHIGIHNFRQEYDEALRRNMGMFWEPGAFAAYLIIALFFLLRDARRYPASTAKVAILIVALLSTQSSTGIIVLFALIVFYVYSSDSLSKLKLLRAPVLLFLFIILTLGVFKAYNSFSFLGEKIAHQMENATVKGERNEVTRFGNFIYDLDFIEKRPLLGWSANPETRFSFDENLEDFITGQGNGLTGFTIRFGLVGILAFMFFFARATWHMSASLPASLFGIFLMSMLLMGEQLMNYPLVMAILFIPKVDTEQNRLLLQQQHIAASWR